MHQLWMVVTDLASSTQGRRVWPFLALLALAAAVACSSPPPTATALPAGPDYSAVVVTRDLALGSNRVVFGLVDRNGMPLRTPEAQVEALYLAPGQATGEVRATATAKFIQWPMGNQGVFITKLDFNQVGLCTTESPGCWALRVSTTGPDGTPVVAVANFPVLEQSRAPGIGQPVPASVTPTGDVVDDLATITSSPNPDPDLYRLSIHEALQAGKPLVVVFATPAFCVTAACGPQVEVVSQLRERFADRANFIHVEVFKDPHLIQGRETAVSVPAVQEWGLPTEPFSFIVAKDGTLHAKFESFSTLEELEEALTEIAGA